MQREDKYKYLQGWMRRLSTIDPPTGLLNRHGWLTFATKHVKRAARRQDQVGIMLIELDGYREVIDRLGVDAGDQALQHVAEVLEAQLRPGDLLGRWVEDGFVLFLPPQDTSHLRCVAERLQKAVETAPLRSGDQDVPVTISIGAASGTCLTGELQELESFISQAEDRLADGRSKGRSRRTV